MMMMMMMGPTFQRTELGTICNQLVPAAGLWNEIYVSDCQVLKSEISVSEDQRGT